MLNVRSCAQNIDVFRDPAVYAITGEWLTHHGSLPIPIHAEVFGSVNGVSFASAAFDPVTTPGFVQSQFSNLLPGLLAVGGWLGGDAMLLRVSPLLGGVAAPALVALANLVNLSADYLHNLRGAAHDRGGGGRDRRCRRGRRAARTADQATASGGGAHRGVGWRRSPPGRWSRSSPSGPAGHCGASAARRGAESQAHYVEFLQKVNRLPHDGTRSYGEQAISSLSGYWGPVNGGARRAWRGVRGVPAGALGDRLLVAPLGMFLSAALLDLSVLSIGPGPDVGDGRYLQLVIPGFLLAAMVVLAVVGQRGRAGRVAASIFVVPLFVSHRLVRVRDGIPQVHGRRLFVLATSPNLVGPDAARPADGHRSAGWPCRTGMRP